MYCKLKEISAPITYGLGASAISFDGIHTYIRITDIDDSGEYLCNQKVSPAFFSEDFLLKKNDILFARTGASVGKTYIHKESKNVYFAGFLMRIRIKEHNPYYIYQQFKTSRFQKWLLIMSIRSGQPGINANELGNYKIKVSAKSIEDKIAYFMKILDSRIQTQKKIIEDLICFKNSILNAMFATNTFNSKLSLMIEQVSKKNKNSSIKNILSISNKAGFIKQSEQFDEREIASDNISNYKLINKDIFAYNPARINVGSIAKYNLEEKGIVSPMYICFKVNNSIHPEYLNFYFKSNEFKKQMTKRLEGSVRQCITYESLINIPFNLPSYDIQKKNADIITAFTKKIEFEEQYMNLLKEQKLFLLSKMFI